MGEDMIYAALKSGCGRIRKNNEDAWYLQGQFAPLAEMDRETAVEISTPLESGLFAVCDGMGGHENGQVASYTSVKNLSLLADMLQCKDVHEAVPQWGENINSQVRKMAPGGGCTLAGAYFHDGMVWTMHVGDSRVYRLHDGCLTCLTRDHTKVRMLVDIGVLTPQEARTHPHRHMITRFLGMDEMEMGPCVVEIEHPVIAEDQDRYLICSDGVTDMLSNEVLECLLNQGENAQTCARLIYDEAMKAGGADNTTLIVLELSIPVTKETTSELQRELLLVDNQDELDQTFCPND